MRRRPQAPDASSTDNPGGAEPGPAPLRGIEESFAFVLLTKRGRSAPVPTSGSATKIAACHRVLDRCAIRCRRPKDLCASDCFGATGSRQRMSPMGRSSESVAPKLSPPAGNRPVRSILRLHCRRRPSHHLQPAQTSSAAGFPPPAPWRPPAAPTLRAVARRLSPPAPWSGQTCPDGRYESSCAVPGGYSKPPDCAW